MAAGGRASAAGAVGEKASGALGTAGGAAATPRCCGDAGSTAPASPAALTIVSSAAAASAGAAACGGDGGGALCASDTTVTPFAAGAPPASAVFEGTRPRQPNPVLISAERLDTGSSAGAPSPPLDSRRAGPASAAPRAEASMPAPIGLGPLLSLATCATRASAAAMNAPSAPRSATHRRGRGPKTAGGAHGGCAACGCGG